MKKRNIPEISVDLLWQILLRLPLRNLFRCKAVCKAWLTIISDPAFCTDYRRWRQPLGCEYAGFFLSCTHRSRRNFVQFIPGGNCINDDVTQKEIPYAFRHQYCPYPKYTEVCVLASSNGILLCGVKLLVPCCSDSNKKPAWAYYVCNPFTREWRALPPYQTTQHAAIGFECHEGEGSRYCYKVVRIIETNVVETYSSDSGQWTTDSCSSNREWFLTRDYSAVVVGGVYHWICGDDFVVSYNPVNNHLDDCVDLPDESVGRSFEWLEMSIGEDAGRNLICYLLDSDGIEMWVRGNSEGTDVFCWWRKHRVEWFHLQQTIVDFAEGWLLAANIEVKVFPGNPNKILLDWFDVGHVAVSYEWGSGNFQQVFDWEGLDIQPWGNYFPYYIPSWHFKL